MFIKDAELMTGRGITIVGLGPAGAEYLTREAWAHLEQCDEIWLRTKFHPAVAGLPDGVQVRSFDEVYDSSEGLEPGVGGEAEAESYGCSASGTC